MYIFVKVYDDDYKGGNGNKPFIVEEKNMDLALDKLTEKYYGMKFSSIRTVMRYPRFIGMIEVIKRM